MNLLLLEPEEVSAGGVARLEDRRAEHLLGVLRVEAGRELRCALLGGGSGVARVRGVEQGAVELEVEITSPPPPPPWIDLVVALPRPQVLHRVLQFSAAMGVGRLDFVNAWRVEKSFFHSPSLGAGKVRRQLLLGAEQGLVPRLPEVRFHHRLLPFLAELEAVREPPRRLLAHPDAETAIEEAFGDWKGGASEAERRCLQIAVGPEGGWIDREVESFEARGFEAVRLGPWTLRVEAALVAAVAQSELLRRFAPGSPQGSSC